MNDEGSLAQAFSPDGSLSAKSNTSIANAVPITFTETTWWWFGGECGR
jgi:hypothetical protein